MKTCIKERRWPIEEVSLIIGAVQAKVLALAAWFERADWDNACDATRW